jgi:hypothetical protein
MTTTILPKYVQEVRIFEMDFSQRTEIVEGDILTGVASITSSPTGLTIGSPVVNASNVQFSIAGGVSGQFYSIACVVSTLAGATLECTGSLEVL